MAGFTKAKPRVSHVKMCLYGAPGSGKTFSSLLMAEGLGMRDGKRIAFVNTEAGGLDFYVETIPDRKVHPEAFDVDELFTRSVHEITKAIEGLDANEHGVIVIDTATHIWEACIASYRGKKNSNGQLPIHAWSSIKAPWKRLINLLLNCPQHVIFCARAGVIYGEDADGKEKALGSKAKAEGETEYEFNHVFELQNVIRHAGKPPVLVAATKKDRSGVFSGRSIEWPNYERIVEPLLNALSTTSRQVEDPDVTAQRDREGLDADEASRAEASREATNAAVAAFAGASTYQQLVDMGKAITPQMKAGLTRTDLDRLKDAWGKRAATLREAEALSA